MLSWPLDPCSWFLLLAPCSWLFALGTGIVLYYDSSKVQYGTCTVPVRYRMVPVHARYLYSDWAWLHDKRTLAVTVRVLLPHRLNPSLEVTVLSYHCWAKEAHNMARDGQVNPCRKALLPSSHPQRDLHVVGHVLSYFCKWRCPFLSERGRRHGLQEGLGMCSKAASILDGEGDEDVGASVQC